MTQEPVTLLLARMADGDVDAGREVYSLVYEELRARARRLVGPSANTLQATAVVHEAWLKIEASHATDWNSRAHFLGVAAKAMRSILCDHARAGRRRKRDPGKERVPLDDSVAAFEERAVDLVALDGALDRLGAIDPQLAKLVELRFFSGLTIAETARVLGVSTPTVERGWRTARSLLRVELDGDAALDALR